MERKQKKRIISKTIANICISIKEHSISRPLLLTISNLLEIANLLIVIDLIGNYKRTWVNYHTYLYWLSPGFLNEFIFLLLGINQTNSYKIIKGTYDTDQILLMVDSLFDFELKIGIQSLYSLSTLGVSLIIVAILLLLHSIKSNMIIVKFAKTISSIILYFLFKTFFMACFLLYNYQVFSQFSDYPSPIGLLFAFQFIFALIFNFYTFIFYKYFIYGYQTNSFSYFVSDGVYMSQFTLNSLSGIIMILRRNPTPCLIFQVLWIAAFVYYSYLTTYDFIFFVNNCRAQRVTYFFIVTTISIFLTRLLTLFIINITGDQIVFQIFEVLIELFASIGIYCFVSSFKRMMTISEINDYLNGSNSLFFVGVHQLFSPLEELYKIKNSDIKIIEKQKEIIFTKYQQDLQEVFCASKKDFSLLDVKALRKASNINSNTVTTPSHDKEYSILLKILILLLKFFIKKTKLKKDSFSMKVNQCLVYKKVILYFLFDDKTIRAEFFLSKFIYSQAFSSMSALGQSVFKGLRLHFLSIERKADDNSMSYLIHFLKLNEEYHSIIKSMSFILKNFSQSKIDLIKIIDSQSQSIGNSFDNIIRLNEKTSDSIKIKEQPEKDKFKLIDDLMFNANIDKSFEKFDISSLDVIVEKNDYFVLYYIKSNFIIKKSPLVYSQITGFKSSKITNKAFISIFPFITGKAQMSIIKKKMLSKKNFSMQTVIESSTHYLLSVKLLFNLLPLLNGKIYLVCSIEYNSLADESNYVLMERNGNSKLFGLYFNHYFTISNTLVKNMNFLSMFTIQEFEPDKDKTYTYNIEISRMVQEMKKILFKDTVYQKKDIGGLVKKIKERFNNSTTSLELITKEKYSLNQTDYYLVQFNFIDFKSSVLCVKNTTRIESIDKYRVENTLSQIRSGSSVASFKLLKETNWNISTKRKEQTKLSKNILDRISFCHNVSLILIAIIIVICTQSLAASFYIDFICLITLRQANSEYYFTQLHLSTSIVIEGNNNIYDSLHQKYQERLPDYSIDIKDYYQKYFREVALNLIELTNDFAKNYNNINPKKSLYMFMQKENTFLQSDGSAINETYFNQFNIPKNNFYILSNRDSFYLELPVVSYENASQEMKTLKEEQQYAVSLMYNSFVFFTHLKDIIYYAKENFKDSFEYYKMWIIVFFFGFLLFNVFSLFLLYLSIHTSNKKIFLISEKIIAVNKKQVEFLQEKAAIIKNVIRNEMKPSIALAKFREKIGALKENKVSSSSLNASSRGGGDDPSAHSYHHARDDNSPLIRKIKKKDIIWFKAYKQVITIFALLSLIYAVFSIITFPIIWSYLEKIETRRLETDTVDDIQGLIIMYYLDIKYAIFFNNTDKLTEIKVFEGFTEYIYLNYTFLNQKLFIDNSNDYLDYAKLINHQPNCLNILPQNEFTESINAVCLEEPLLLTTIETMLSSFITELRAIYTTFVLSQRTKDDIIKAFHHEEFQRACLIESIYFIPFFKEIKFQFLLVDFESNINTLSLILVIVFVLMVFIEIGNYFLSTVFVLRVLANSLNNYTIIEKFFSLEKAPTNK